MANQKLLNYGNYFQKHLINPQYTYMHAELALGFLLILNPITSNAYCHHIT